MITGGECNIVQPFNPVEAFNVETGRWRTLAPMPIGKHGITAATDGTDYVHRRAATLSAALSYSNRLVTFTLPYVPWASASPDSERRSG